MNRLDINDPSLLARAKQARDGKLALVIPGKWPNSGRKRLFGTHGPTGECICEYEDACLVVFDSHQVASCIEKKINI